MREGYDSNKFVEVERDMMIFGRLWHWAPDGALRVMRETKKAGTLLTKI